MKHVIRLFITVLLMLISFTAYAESCDQISTDNDWITNIQSMKANVAIKQYESALETGRDLYAICSQSPALNYYIAMALNGKGEKAKAMQHLINASENTMIIATPTETSRLIWNALYEFEHPDRTDEAVSAITSENETLKVANQSQAEQIEVLQNEVLALTNQNYQEKRDHIYTNMWTGAGIGIGGLSLTIVGAVLALVDDSYISVSSEKIKISQGMNINTNSNYKISPKYISGVSLLSIGLALTVAGSILTGFYGYQYTHLEEAPVTFDLSYNQISMTMKF